MPTLTIKDETTSGESVEALTLEFLTERITVRELIRSRVHQEVKDYNATRPDVFRGLVQPSDFEKTLNGYKAPSRRPIDWQKQFDKAISAFEANQVLILVDDRQTESLEQEIVLTPGTEVTFLRLVPLVGG